MNKLLLIFGILLFQSNVRAQINNDSVPPPKAPTREIMEQERKNYGCLTVDKYTAVERRQFYPFNEAKQVWVVSFEKKSSDLENHLPMQNDTVCINRLHEIKVLNLQQVDTLTNILFNIGYKGKIIYNTAPACYNPYNAILFIDEKGSVFEWLEIYFECGYFNVSSEKMELGEFCREKYAMLEKIFKDWGIKLLMEEPWD